MRSICCTHRHTRDPPPSSLFPSPVRYQWQPSCCQTHSPHTERRPALVKLLKWHYSGQFFSLYLKCLNVWQMNQSSYSACASCAAGEKEVKDTEMHPLPTERLEELTRYEKKQEKVRGRSRLGQLISIPVRPGSRNSFLSLHRRPPSPVDTHLQR